MPVAAQKKSVRGQSTQAAFGQLRDLIVRGRLAPGTWIIEADISDRLGLSRTPVRGALQRLHREGYVTASGSGAKSRLAVAPLTQEDARELYAIIGHIEGLGARQAAGLPSTARQQLLDELQSTNAALQSLVDAKRAEPGRIFELDLAFHSALMEAGSGPRLIELHRTVQPQAERYWRLYSGVILNELDQSVQEHTDIITAIRLGDVDAAERGVQLNWMNGLARLSAVITSLGERGSW